MTRYEFLVNFPNMDIDTKEEATMLLAQCSKREPKQTAEPKSKVLFEQNGWRVSRPII